MNREDQIAIGFLGVVTGIPAITIGIINALKGVTMLSILGFSGLAALCALLWLLLLFIVDDKVLPRKNRTLTPEVTIGLLIIGEILICVAFATI